MGFFKGTPTRQTDHIMTDRYNFSLTTFSPSGKLGQIEYALNAVNQGVLCVGIKGKPPLMIICKIPSV